MNNEKEMLELLDKIRQQMGLSTYDEDSLIYELRNFDGKVPDSSEYGFDPWERERKILLFELNKLAQENNITLEETYNLPGNVKRDILQKLNGIDKLLGECRELADKNNVSFDFWIRGISDTYDGNQGWNNSYC